MLLYVILGRVCVCVGVGGAFSNKDIWIKIDFGDNKF